MTFHFEDFALDPRRRELTRAETLIAVEPQVFDLIHYLVRERERVVTKDDLLDTIWSGRIVSESTLTTRINAARRALNDSGEQQRLIRTVARKGFRFVGEVREQRATAPSRPAPAPNQEITFCKTSDGVSIAISTCGKGPPLVKVGTWLTHVEHDWRTPVWGPFYARLAEEFRLIHYDPRGCGLSERNPAEMSVEGLVRDLTAVIDACGLERFSLLCFSQGAAVGCAFAARNPERVTRMVLSGGFPLGWRKRGNEAEIATREAMMALIKHGWGQDNPAFRQIFTTRMWPDLTAEQMKAFDELQRFSATPESAARIQSAVGDIHVVALLSKIVAPTLVIHSREDGNIPLEMGLMLARGIPGARFLEIDSRNHIPMSHEPVWPQYIGEICAFLSQSHAAEVSETRSKQLARQPGPEKIEQSIRYCTTPDGVRLAVGVCGEGNPIVKVSNWMNHVAFDFDNPLWSHLYRRLAERRKFVHYDGRGIGLSDRIVQEISFESFVTDLETVIDSLGFEKVSLVGMSMGVATAIAYAARHPERIHKMVLHGGFAVGRRRRNVASDLERADLFLSLMRQGWGKQDAAFIKAFACIYFPNATEEQLRWFTELQQQNASAETAVRIRAACDDIDVTDLLSSIKSPVLVTHCQNDQVVPFEQGRHIASLLPNATLLPLQSANHMVLNSEPVGAQLADAIDAFFGAELAAPEKGRGEWRDPLI